MNRATLRLASVLIFGAAMPALATGCSSTVTRVHRSPPIRGDVRWVLLPFSNHSETPQAGERVEAMVSTILRQRGLSNLDVYASANANDEKLALSEDQKFAASLDWARQQRFNYAVAGSVEEWRYKTGIDAEPAVAVSLRVIDLGSGKTVWSASGAKTGGSGDSAAGTALKAIDNLLQELTIAGS